MLFVMGYALFFSFPKLVLSFLQLNFIRQEKAKPPYILESSAFLKAADYASVREKLQFIM